MTEDQTKTRLYLVTPMVVDAAALRPILEAALDAGDVASVLLELAPGDSHAAKKIVQALAPAIQGRGAALLLRDPAQAARLGAAGAHIAAGESFESRLRDAVDSLKPERIVGAGALNSKHEAMRAGEIGADYAMFGDPSAEGESLAPEIACERIAWWAEIFNLPCVAFAANCHDAARYAAAGADFIALGEAIWRDPRGPAAAVKDAIAAIGAAGKARKG